MQPALFVAHGSPMLALEEDAYTEFLSTVGEALGRPRAVALFSAHFEHPTQHVGAASRYETIHDFGGFPPALYALRYPAPGDPDLAYTIVQHLQDAGVTAVLDRDRGLDHGAWVPLRRLFPNADVPVIALSVNAALAVEEQYRIGAALAPLREDGVVILGSGVTVHNFGEMGPDGNVAPWAVEFDQWLTEAIANWDLDALYDYQARAPHANRAAPPFGREHLVPLFYAMGAADNERRGARLFQSYRFSTLSHNVFQFGGRPLQKTE